MPKMERINDLIKQKRRVFTYYQERLRGFPGLCMNPGSEGTINGYWMPTVVLHPSIKISREDMQHAFSEAAIDARVFFWPLSSLPSFNIVPASSTYSQSIPERAINLPSYHDITELELERVCDVLKALLNKTESAESKNGET